MHVDLLPLLRCLAPHEEAPLIAAVAHASEGRIVTGTLGCAVCGAEYAIREGNAHFGAAGHATADSGDAVVIADDEVTRLAAMLNLDERGGAWALGGRWSAFGAALADMFAETSSASVPVRILLLPDDTVPRAADGRAQERPASASVSEAPAILAIANAIPLAAGSLRGIAIDRSSAGLGAAAARVLAANGRLVAPVAAPVPAGVRELARDARHWVGEREHDASGPLVIPRRAAPRTVSR